MEKTRDSKYELLRIVSMFMIVLWHVIGRVMGSTTGQINMILFVAQVMLVVHVNSFILVTGYYQCKSNFKFKKLVSLNNAAWFYRVTIMLALIFFNYITVGHLELVKNLFPIDLGYYWFIDLYLILYCLSPYLNLLISKLDQPTFKKLLLTLFILISLLPTFTNQLAYYNNSGYSLMNFIMLYFIGAYFRNYKLEILDFLKVKTNKARMLLYSSLFFLLCFINMAINIFAGKLGTLGTIATAMGQTISHATISYDNPLVILCAIMYFLWFGCLDIKSKFLNGVGALTFGVYLIHEEVFIRMHLYNFLGFRPGNVYDYSILMKILIAAVGIFVICLIVEWIRQLMFKLISKLWLSRKIKQKWYNYIEEVKGVQDSNALKS